ncbi:MAG: hypothetical protein ACI4UN_00810 [Muribaculaceae bacterium]
MLRSLLYILVACSAALGLAGCGGGSATSTRAPEARSRAVEAAAKLIATSHTDTMAMQHAILDAKAIQSEYILAGDTAAVHAFDKAFSEKLLNDDPQLADAVL